MGSHSSFAKGLEEGSRAIVLTLSDDYSGGMTRDEFGENSLYHLLELDRRGLLEISEACDGEPIVYSLSPLGKELAECIEQESTDAASVPSRQEAALISDLEALFRL